MGWTHDYRDVACDQGGNGAAQARQRAARRVQGPPFRDPAAGLTSGRDLHIGFPHILRRRARWVGVRLRHPRG